MNTVGRLEMTLAQGHAFTWAIRDQLGLIPGLPPSDPGPVCPVGPQAPFEDALQVPDTRPDECKAAEAQDRALEGALRSVLTPFEAGVLRRRYWNGWTWEQIGRYYWGGPGCLILSRSGAIRSPAEEVQAVHDRAIRALREALR